MDHGAPVAAAKRNNPVPSGKVATSLLMVLLWTITEATMDITNYTNAQTVTIHRGLGKLQTSSTKLVHVIDLNQIQEALDLLNSHTEEGLKRSPLYSTIHHELIATTNALKTITDSPNKRKSRSLNWLGTGWKYIGSRS
ncbi:uncharacterized protein LOC133849941 [Drosophila sulfurigaster albostrigata]|uniref:uncharacterized protein LOC133849941 n=1 Tax=Drosophila sulfurigaster albostrigata TaxID=89887 RepID=UPI002D21B125|nr:uncharacterized protein LOC133849941 [Drosophila sulfurigaster albostrigata]